jgi:Tfp pilus assembly protein PilN
MNHWTNLLPVKNQVSFERRRQVRLWSTAWVALSLALLAIYGVLDRQRIQLMNSIEAAEASVAPIREAEIELVELRNEKQRLYQLSLTADSLQQTDAPLALLQTVGSSCQDLGKKVQIDSLRIDEISSPNSVAGKAHLTRKQILLVGSADADFLITAFVNRLVDCGVFRKVELESSHALADKLAAKRSFQIRCQQ